MAKHVNLRSLFKGHISSTTHCLPLIHKGCSQLLCCKLVKSQEHRRKLQLSKTTELCTSGLWWKLNKNPPLLRSTGVIIIKVLIMLHRGNHWWKHMANSLSLIDNTCP